MPGLEGKVLLGGHLCSSPPCKPQDTIPEAEGAHAEGDRAETCRAAGTPGGVAEPSNSLGPTAFPPHPNHRLGGVDCVVFFTICR